MSYSTHRASLLAETLERMATVPAHHLVGHRDNLDFWIAEAVSAIAVLDGYRHRFRAMKVAQAAWVGAHEVKVPLFCEVCGGSCEFGPVAPDPPRRIPTTQLDEARLTIRESVRRFLLRMYRAYMIDRARLESAAAEVGTGFEPDELERRDPPGAGE